MNIMLSHVRASVVETKGDAVTTASWNKGKCQKVSIRAWGENKQAVWSSGKRE